MSLEQEDKTPEDSLSAFSDLDFMAQEIGIASNALALAESVKEYSWRIGVSQERIDAVMVQAFDVVEYNLQKLHSTLPASE